MSDNETQEKQWREARATVGCVCVRASAVVQNNLCAVRCLSAVG